MTLSVFDTLSGTERPLSTLKPGQVSLYVCGPTVYGEPHLGHARAGVVFDVMVRYLSACGYRVTHARNVTDVDDKIIAAAGRRRMDYRRLGDHCLRRYREAMSALNVLPPDMEPRVTDYILPIQSAVERLIQTGHAYPSGGDVYFNVTSFDGYGRLSGRTAADALQGEAAADRSGKRHPADFALWKAAGADTPSWPSPWGPGRPGWHIECSVMCAAVLGKTVDIHGGGMDLVFPHHENEIAQSECLHGQPPASCWIHNGMVTREGQKMSKSTASGVPLPELLSKFQPDALRLWLLSKRYRKPLPWVPGVMTAAAASSDRLQRFFSHPAARAGMSDLPRQPRRGTLWRRFCDAMDADFNFPGAISIVFDGVKCIRRQWDTAPGHGAGSDDIAAMIADLAYICRNVLGLKLMPDPPSRRATATASRAEAIA